MKIAICDDEQPFIDAVCSILEQWAQKYNITLSLYRFTNGDALITTHQNESMDLIILDVIMPLLNGIDTAKELREHDPDVPIIFLTSSREFAVNSYEVKAFHYLMKPIDTGKLFNVLDDFLATFKYPKSTFTARTADGFYRIALDDIEYLEAQNRTVHVYMSNGNTIIIRELFSKCEEVLSPEKGFCRCHRSYIVNLNKVEQFSKTEITTTQGISIPISRNRYFMFKESYFQHMFG